jgi:hypothetical protein
MVEIRDWLASLRSAAAGGAVAAYPPQAVMAAAAAAAALERGVAASSARGLMVAMALVAVPQPVEVARAVLVARAAVCMEVAGDRVKYRRYLGSPNITQVAGAADQSEDRRALVGWVEVEQPEQMPLAIQAAVAAAWCQTVA